MIGMKRILPVVIIISLFSCGPSYVDPYRTDAEMKADFKECTEITKKELLRKNDDVQYIDCRELATEKAIEDTKVDGASTARLQKTQSHYQKRRFVTYYRECARSIDKGINECMIGKGYETKQTVQPAVSGLDE